MDPLVVWLAVTWVALGLGCWLGYQLVLQNGRILLRLEALEGRRGPARAARKARFAGLPVGSLVLDFELPNLSGDRMTFSRWRGRRVLLIFLDPECAYSREMLPALAALPPDPSNGHPVPLVLTTGDADKNRRLAEEHGVRCAVLLQQDREVASLYRVAGTPMGYVIDEHGVTASELLVGAQALLAVAGPASTGPTGRSGEGAPLGAGGNLRDLVTRAPVKSRINRDGLAAGTLAPTFRLPRLGGGEVSLEAYRGRRVLLVFWDPACGPCDRLAPRLEQVHRRSAELQVLMISRGDPEANRAKVAEHGLTFPVALQRHWEISRDYGMFATPIGYLVDERGVITSGVAIGAEAILALASPGAGHTHAEQEVLLRG